MVMMEAALVLPLLSSLFGSGLSVFLKLQPNQCIFERKRAVLLSCEEPGPRSGPRSGPWSGPWSVLRNTTVDTQTLCGVDWGRWIGSACRVSGLAPEPDSGQYWCESADGSSSQPVTITVTERLEPNISTACPPPASPPPAPPPPAPPFSTPAPQPLWLWPVLGSALGPVLELLLVLLVLRVLRVLRCRAGKQNGGSEETTCCGLLASHDHRPQIHRELYSTVCYSLITQTRDVADPVLSPDWSMIWFRFERHSAGSALIGRLPS